MIQTTSPRWGWDGQGERERWGVPGVGTPGYTTRPRRGQYDRPNRGAASAIDRTDGRPRRTTASRLQFRRCTTQSPNGAPAC